VHVNPFIQHRGLALLFNPLDQALKREVALPLYYTGLTNTARIREKEGAAKTFKLDREFSVRVPVEIPANGYTWLVIEP